MITQQQEQQAEIEKAKSWAARQPGASTPVVLVLNLLDIIAALRSQGSDSASIMGCPNPHEGCLCRLCTSRRTLRSQEQQAEILEQALARITMSHTARYEADADAFYQETGFIAVGRSIPLEMAGADQNERRHEAWNAWSAHFDARVFTIPDPVEVENYFIWRQQDATRNSISGLAQAHFSPKQLHGVNNAQMQEMLFREKGINWNDTPTDQKRGRMWVYADEAWVLDKDIPVFTADRGYLSSLIPVLGYHETVVVRETSGSAQSEAPSLSTQIGPSAQETA